MSRPQIAILWSVVKTTTVTVVFIRFGLPLLSLASANSTATSLIAGIGCLTRIPDAIKTADKEHRQIKVEKSAFERFGTEVQQIRATDTVKSSTENWDRHLFRGTTQTAEDGMKPVRALYRETVMSIEHYEGEYDEPLTMNIAAELGPDFATAVMTHKSLNTSLREALAQSSYEAASERAEFAGVVDSELESLTAAEERLEEAINTIESVRTRDVSRQPLDWIGTAEEQLQTVERDCTSLIESRQTEYVHAPEEDGIRFREYLYQQHDWTHPVVGDALDVIRKARNAEQRLITTVLNRV